jgi:molybdopterin synthase sulfur carrier subunit
MSVTVVIPQQLRNYTAGAREVTAAGATVDDALTHLDRRFPGLRFRVVDEQNRIRQHMRIFVDGARVTEVGARVKPQGEMHIFGALSGG